MAARSFLDLPEMYPPTTSFQGSWTQWQRFLKLKHSLFLQILHCIFSKHVLLRKWLSIVPRAPVISTSKFSGVLNTMAKWSRWVQIWQIYPPVLTSCGQDEFKFGRSTLLSNRELQMYPLPSKFTGVLNTMTKWSRWVQIWLIYPPVLTSCGQDEFKFGRSYPYSSLGRYPPTPSNGNFRFLLSQLI